MFNDDDRQRSGHFACGASAERLTTRATHGESAGTRRKPPVDARNAAIFAAKFAPARRHRLERRPRQRGRHHEPHNADGHRTWYASRQTIGVDFPNLLGAQFFRLPNDASYAKSSKRTPRYGREHAAAIKRRVSSALSRSPSQSKQKSGYILSPPPSHLLQHSTPHSNKHSLAHSLAHTRNTQTKTYQKMRVHFILFFLFLVSLLLTRVRSSSPFIIMIAVDLINARARFPSFISSAFCATHVLLPFFPE